MMYGKALGLACGPATSPEASYTSELWKDFLCHYEELTGLLCSAAKDGSTVHLEIRYRKIRAWFRTHYHQIGPSARPYMQHGKPGITVAVVFRGKCHQRRPADAIERLAFQRSLHELLSTDSGGLIGEISRISEVIYALDETMHKKD